MNALCESGNQIAQYCTPGLETVCCLTFTVQLVRSEELETYLVRLLVGGQLCDTVAAFILCNIVVATFSGCPSLQLKHSCVSA